MGRSSSPSLRARAPRATALASCLAEWCATWEEWEREYGFPGIRFTTILDARPPDVKIREVEKFRVLYAAAEVALAKEEKSR